VDGLGAGGFGAAAARNATLYGVVGVAGLLTVMKTEVALCIVNVCGPIHMYGGVAVSGVNMVLFT
jgi:hypothetical protein